MPPAGFEPTIPASKFDVHGSVHRKCIFRYNQREATLHSLFTSVKFSTCFRRFLRPSSGAQICIHSIGYFVKPLLLNATVVPSLPQQWQVAVKVWQSTRWCIYSFWTPDDGRRNPLKHVEHFTEINKLCNVASCWLYMEKRLRCAEWWTSNWLLLSIADGHFQGTTVYTTRHRQH
jgi:hypothetical protein